MAVESHRDLIPREAAIVASPFAPFPMIKFRPSRVIQNPATIDRSSDPAQCVYDREFSDCNEYFPTVGDVICSSGSL